MMLGLLAFFPFQRKMLTRIVSLNELLPPSNTVFYYIPNTLIAAELKREIFRRSSEIYDEASYQMAELRFAASTASTKPFELVLRSKTDPPAIQVLKGIISGPSNAFSITVRNNANQDIRLFTGNLSNVMAELKGSTSYKYVGPINLTYKNKSLIASYSPANNAINEIITHMESDSRYQMLGLGLVFPSQFISGYTTQRPIELDTDGSEIISKIQMSGITMRSAPNNKVAAEFIIDNGSLPTQLHGRATIDKEISLLERMYDYSYSKDNLTQVEIQLMDYFAKQVEDYANQKVVNMRLVPRVRGDSLLFHSAAITHFRVKMVDGRINYFKENIICSIDLDM
jgi:hypothetical protein